MLNVWSMLIGWKQQGQPWCYPTSALMIFWFVLLRIQAIAERGEKGWLTFLRENPAKVIAYTPRLEEATSQILDSLYRLLVELSASQSLRGLTLMKRVGSASQGCLARDHCA